MNLSKIFDRVFNLVSLIAVAMMMIPLSLMLLDGRFPGSSLFLPAFAVFSTVLGYVIQNTVSKAAHKTASRDGFGSLKEGILAGFSIKYAGIPITVVLVLSIPVLFLFDGYMQSICDAGIIDYTTILYAIFFAVIFFVSALCGCIIWFYPLERLANVYILLASASIFFIEFALALVTSQPGTNTVLILGLAFAVFLICMMVVFNQNNLQQKYRGSVVSVMTPEARMYNLFLVFLLLLFMLAVFAVMYVFLSGVYLLARIVLYYIIYKIFYGYTNPESQYDEYAYLEGDEAADLFMKNAMMDQGDRILLSYFFAGGLTLAAVIVGLRTGVLQKAWRTVKEWLSDFFSTIFIGSDIFRSAFDPNEQDTLYNYKDEKKKLQNANIRDFEGLADSTDNYKLFLQRLGRLKTYDEQLCYAYVMLIRMYKKMNINLKLSDTPREMEKKIARTLTPEEIEQITRDFESIRYAETEKTDEEAAAILNNLCTTIKRYLF